MTMLEHALEYARLGLRVLPLHYITAAGQCSCGDPNCTSPGKHPMTRTGVKSATTDETMIRRWWEAAPEANIGIATGAESGVWVLDVDEKSGGYESLMKLLEKYGDFSDTWKASTGGGGTHIYFRHPGLNVANAVGKVARGIDVRGDGGYVVAPPSNHKSGRSYSWDVEPGFNELMDAPQQLLEDMKGIGIIGGAAPSQGQYRTAEPVPDAFPEGQRNRGLFEIAASLRAKGLADNEILGALREANRTRCKPPLGDDEVRSIARSASRYERGELQIEKAVEQPKPEATHFEFKPYKVNTIDPAALPPLEFVWEDILPTGLGLLIGPPKFGKSFMSLGLANAVARGESYLGRRTEHGDVLYMALEDSPRRIYKRLNKLDPRPVPDELEAVHNAPPIGPELTSCITQWVKDHKNPRLVIIDILSKVRNSSSKNDSKYDFDTKELGVVKKVADDNNISILIVHHNSKKKDTDDIFNTTNGTQGINGSADAIMLLTGERLSASTTDCKLEVTGRDAEPCTLHLLFEDCAWRTVGDTTAPIEQDPVVRTLLSWWKAEGPFTWKGTASDMILKLSYYELASGVTNAVLGKALAKNRNMLRAKYGINVFDSRKNKARSWTIEPFQPTFQEVEEPPIEVPEEFLENDT